MERFRESFRFITPLLVTIALFMLSGIQSNIKQIDDKMFKHLTNDEIHTPKSIVVSKPEFTIYQTMRDKQMSDIKEMVSELRGDLKCALERKR